MEGASKTTAVPVLSNHRTLELKKRTKAQKKKKKKEQALHKNGFTTIKSFWYSEVVCILQMECEYQMEPYL